jgi:hypothetical protein
VKAQIEKLAAQKRERVTLDGIGGIGYVPAMLSIFGFSVFMLALGQALADRVKDVLPIPPKLSNETLGSAALFVAGTLMIAGF